MNLNPTAKPGRRRFFYLAAFVFFCFGVFWLVRAVSSKDERLVSLEQEVRALREKKAYLVRGIDEAQEREFVEQEAKQRLNMAYPGEVIVVLPGGADVLEEQGRKEGGGDGEIWERWLRELF